MLDAISASAELALSKDRRRHSGHQPAAGLHAGAVQGEVLGGVRACVRDLPERDQDVYADPN